MRPSEEQINVDVPEINADGDVERGNGDDVGETRNKDQRGASWMKKDMRVVGVRRRMQRICSSSSSWQLFHCRPACITHRWLLEVLT